jgi:mevalonate kinase
MTAPGRRDASVGADAGRDAALPGGGTGRGKVILVGEHAAVYGHPALAGALACGVTLRASLDSSLRSSLGTTGAAGERSSRRSEGSSPHVEGVSQHVEGISRSVEGITLRVDGWNVAVRSDEERPLGRAVAAVAEALGVTAADVIGHADVPPGAGLGSSAALAVALVRALAASCGRVLDDTTVEAIADRAERCFHGNPSGIDVAIAARGGMGLYRRGHGLSPIAAAPIPLVIGLSGQPRSTADMVARVAAARAARPAEVDADLAALGAHAERAAALLTLTGSIAGGPTPGLVELGAIFCDAHQRLAGLGVSTDLLDAMVSAAIQAGALGAKLTGGGGGGAVIALAPGREDAVLAAWRALGKHGLVTHVGVSSS